MEIAVDHHCVIYFANFDEGHSDRDDRDDKDATGIIQVFVCCPNDAAENLEEIKGVENFVD